VVRGRLKETATAGTLACGENVLLPYAGQFAFTATDDSLLLVTENFT
jgi:hypothetical protein